MWAVRARASFAVGRWKHRKGEGDGDATATPSVVTGRDGVASDPVVVTTL
jgi:hypothetical protein